MSVEFPDPRAYGEDVPDGSFGGARPTRGGWRLWSRAEQQAHVDSLEADLCAHAAELARHQPDPACPTPRKPRYATAEAAEIAAERTVIPFGRQLNAYTCRCGWVHLTHLASPDRYRDGAA
ncbi:hypothetical protein [Streptomyces sp. NPDC088674]|uniref:hypothetical protein n=1 Tax=Streptomyces sp. NPDC088674 TaxID=3365869 RepID=UPI0038266C97